MIPARIAIHSRRITPEMVHDSTTHAPPDRCIWCNPAVGCLWPRCLPEMGCTAGGAPSVPTRRNRRPTRPHLSTWQRLLLAWTRFAAGIRRTST